MPLQYKTLFIDSYEVKASSMIKNYQRQINGDQLARDIQAALAEMSLKGFRLCQMSPVTSSLINNRVYTEGVLLVFEKEQIT